MSENAKIGHTSHQLPSKHLPAVEYRDLPDPIPLRKAIGASVVLLATALGAGEFILWPYITQQVGPGLLWLAVVAFTLSLFIYMEIERYTLATGETAVTGFMRLWKPWGLIFVIGAVLAYMWPGWATSSAALLTMTFGLPESSITLIAILTLVVTGVALTLSPVIYHTLEKTDTVIVIIVAAFMLVAVVLATDLASWSDLITETPRGVMQLPEFASQLGGAVIFGALALVGGNGFNLLVQSNYLRDKGLGMGRFIPRVVSPLTGVDQARPSIGYLFPTDEANMRRWKGWWKVANQEQLIVYYLLGVASLLVLPILTHATVPQGSDLGKNLAFVEAEGAQLKEIIAPWFGTFFYFAGFLLLFSTALGTMDFVGRIVGDALKVGYLRESRFWSESKIYIATVWTLILLGSIVLLSGFNQPLLLLLVSSVGQGIAMVIYTVLLIRLNRRALPSPIALRGPRLVMLVLSLAFYGSLAAYAVIDLLT